MSCLIQVKERNQRMPSHGKTSKTKQQQKTCIFCSSAIPRRNWKKNRESGWSSATPPSYQNNYFLCYCRPILKTIIATFSVIMLTTNQWERSYNHRRMQNHDDRKNVLHQVRSCTWPEYREAMCLRYYKNKEILGNNTSWQLSTWLWHLSKTQEKHPN